MDLRKIVILGQKSEFLSHQKVRLNKSHAHAFYSYIALRAKLYFCCLLFTATAASAAIVAERERHFFSS